MIWVPELWRNAAAKILIETPQLVLFRGLGTAHLFQTQYTKETLRTYHFWNATLCIIPMQLNMLLSKADCDKNPESCAEKVKNV